MAKAKRGRSKLLGTLRRLGLSRGVGRSNAWLALGLGAWGLEVLRRAFTREPAKVYEEELRVGEQLVVTHLPPGS